MMLAVTNRSTPARYYVMVDPEESIAKVYRLHDGRYIKVLDASKDNVEFDLGKCSIQFDFAKIWL